MNLSPPRGTRDTALDLIVIALMLRHMARPDTEGQGLSRALTGVMGIGLLAILLGEMTR